jgi:hypothetical protein
MTDHDASAVQPFVTRWHASGAAERANYQLFLSELCDLLEVPRPNPATPDEADNAYVFEKGVPLPHGATERIDLYRRGCFVLEAKQGSDRAEPGPALSQEAEHRLKARKRGAAGSGGLASLPGLASAAQVAAAFADAPPDRVAELLETLVTLGQARQTAEGRFVG